MTPLFPVFLHGGQPVRLDTWTLDPLIVAGSFIGLVAYVYALISLRPDGEKIDWKQVAAYFTGSLLIFLALASPIDPGAGRLLFLHMLQHVILASLAPPLILLGLPAWLLRIAIPAGAPRRLLQTITQPLPVAVLFILNMWAWHVPPVYEFALNHLAVHIVEHLLFIGTGLLFWWPIVSPLPEISRIGSGGRLLYLFVTGFPMGILALLLLSAGTIVYGFYATGPRLWGVDPLTDQQIAGVIMGSLGEATSFIAFSVLFWRYLGSEEEASDDARRLAPAQRP